MTKKINEYIQKPILDKLTPEEQYQWYLIAKRDLPWFDSTGDTTALKQAINDYEQRNNIK